MKFCLLFVVCLATIMFGQLAADPKKDVTTTTSTTSSGLTQNCSEVIPVGKYKGKECPDNSYYFDPMNPCPASCEYPEERLWVYCPFYTSNCNGCRCTEGYVVNYDKNACVKLENCNSTDGKVKPNKG